MKDTDAQATESSNTFQFRSERKPKYNNDQQLTKLSLKTHLKVK